MEEERQSLDIERLNPSDDIIKAFDKWVNRNNPKKNNKKKSDQPCVETVTNM